jgi:GNAT superfamily N-acetyltransferase
MIKKHMNSPEEKISVKIDNTPKGVNIDLNFDDGVGEYGGFIYSAKPDRVVAGPLMVEPAYRGKGIGEELVRKLIDEAKSLGANKLTGHIESQYALDIRARIFGKSALKFYDDNAAAYDRDEYPEKYDELPITFDQARQSLVRAEEHEDDLDYRDLGFHVEVDLPAQSGEKSEE